MKNQKQSQYDHTKIEKKWQKYWTAKKIYKTTEDTKKEKLYVLDMFPYPSGVGLHVGHPRGYVASDVYARFKRMNGFNVLHPMGYDAFGLPAEQYAIQNKIHPKKAVEENIETFRKQLDLIGLSYDWSRVVNTTDPKYYKWTQWIFLKLYESWYNKISNKAEPIENLTKFFEKEGNQNIDAVCDSDIKIFSATEWKSFSDLEKHNILMKYRLAFEGFSEVNWCPEMGTVLANDEIIDGPDGKPVSERGGYPVEKKTLRQWFLRITAYADRLIEGLDRVDWSQHIKEIQKNWVGKSIGSEITFAIKGMEEKINVFTTRADTLFGVTYVVLAPETDLVKKLLSKILNRKEVEKYIADVKLKTDEDRMSTVKEKTGVILEGVKAINPANQEEVPVFVADYVLATYGTGMVMAVPAHDDRDFAFAKKYNLPIREAIVPERIDKRNPPVPGKKIVERKNVHVVVKNPKTGMYVGLKYRKHDWTTFPMGGIEEGESLIDSAKRELLEETGYKNVTEGVILGGQVRAEYFAAHKDQNRVSYTNLVYFELLDEEKEKISDEENEEHEVIWLSEKDINSSLMTHAEMDIWLDRLSKGDIAYTDNGIMVNSGEFNGLNNLDAIKKITDFVGGKIVTKYKMRDAVFARQRYWGEPIPLIHKKDGTISTVNENKLPLELPNVISYEPIGNGESPLAGVKDWVEKGYETNTMPGWAGSSWYFLRYMDPQNKKGFVGEKALKYWKQVDMYVGGAEHATGHLLYSRFWNKFLFDYGLVIEDEPFKALRNQGMIQGSDGRRMSKRWGNVVNPDEVVKNVGADTLRVYESFMGPFEQEISWSTDSMVGSRRFLERVWKLQEKVVANFADSSETEALLHKTIKKVGEDIDSFNANTAISSMMILLNHLDGIESISEDLYLNYIKILSPFAPHMCEEIWANLEQKKSIVLADWPKYDESKIKSAKVNIPVQINGRVRASLIVDTDLDQTLVEKLALENPDVKKWLEGKEIKKKIFVKNKILNLVI
ncbi:MAG: class I tRNA ligase family protein [Candidatus Paceibacterota bacterium]|jgi:leucyl-tRNA synthetase